MRKHAAQRRWYLAVAKSDGARTEDGFLWRSVGVAEGGGDGFGDDEERKGDGKLLPKVPKKKDATTEEKEEATSKASKPLAASQPMYKKITPVQTSKPKVMVSSTTKKVGLGAKKVGAAAAG